MTISLLRAQMAAAVATALFTALPVSAAPAKAARTVTIHVGDELKYSVTRIPATPGERLRIVLVDTGKAPKTVMGHNVVVLKKGTDPAAFANASATARDTDYIAPSVKAQVLAHTPLVGPGETVETTFQVPTVPGNYDYICSFPGHMLAGMKGVLAVGKKAAAGTH